MGASRVSVEVGEGGGGRGSGQDPGSSHDWNRRLHNLD